MKIDAKLVKDAVMNLSLFVALFTCLSIPTASAQGVRQLPSPAGDGSGQSYLSVGRRGRV